MATFKILIELDERCDLKDASILYNQVLLTIAEKTGIINIKRVSLENKGYQELLTYSQSPHLERAIKNYQDDKKQEAEETKAAILSGISKLAQEDEDAIN